MADVGGRLGGGGRCKVGGCINMLSDYLQTICVREEWHDATYYHLH